MNESVRGVPTEVFDDLHLFRYREAFHLSYQEAINEPVEEIARARLIWLKEREHDNKVKARSAVRSK